MMNRPKVNIQGVEAKHGIIFKMLFLLSLLGILFEMRLLNLSINFIADFCPHLGSFFLNTHVVFSLISPIKKKDKETRYM